MGIFGEIIKGIIKTKDGIVYVIKDSGLFTLPEIDDIHTRLSEGEANTILLEQLEME